MADHSRDATYSDMTKLEVIERLRALARHTNPAVLSTHDKAPWREACLEAAALLSEMEPKVFGTCRQCGYLIAEPVTHQISHPEFPDNSRNPAPQVSGMATPGSPLPNAKADSPTSNGLESAMSAKVEVACNPAAAGPAPVSAIQNTPKNAEDVLAAQGVFAGHRGLRGLARADQFWSEQPYGTRFYFGPGGMDYLHRSVLIAAVDALDEYADKLQGQASAPSATQAIPDGWLLVPATPNNAILRPFYECPADELELAWNAMLAIATVQFCKRSATDSGSAT